MIQVIELCERGSGKGDYAQLTRVMMDRLRGHLGPEFTNRIDDVIVSRAFERQQVRSMRVARQADPSLMAHLATVGVRAGFGACGLRRLMRPEIEIQPACARRSGMLAGAGIRHGTEQDTPGTPAPDADAGSMPARDGTQAAE